MLCSAYFALVRFVGSFDAVTGQVSVAAPCFIFVYVVQRCAGFFNCSNCFCYRKNSFAPKFWNVVFGDEASHAQRGGSINTLVTRITCLTKNMGRNMNVTLKLKQKLIANADKHNIPPNMGNTNSDTNHVFGVVQNAETSIAGDEAKRPNEYPEQKQ